MAHTVQDLALAVKRVQHSHHRRLNRALAELGVSLVQWDTLRHLHRNPGASLHDLAQLTFQTDQSFGALAARMVDRGLIERLPGPGRAVKHRLTAQGEAIRRAGSEVVDDVVAASFAPLAEDELEQLGELLDRLVAQPAVQEESVPRTARRAP
jgi:DNA-binding MarR family transcriptional regulator